MGQAVVESGLPRSEIFVTTKIYAAGADVEETYSSCKKSVERIGGYADLFLVHNSTVGPAKIKLLWQALERLHKEGKAKAIGVSNFNKSHLERLKEYATVWPPAVNQLEV